MSHNIQTVALNPRQNKYQEMTLSTIKERLSFKDEFSFTTPHILKFYTLLLVTEGAYRHVLGSKIYHLKKGDLFIICPNQVHNFIDLEGFDGYIITFSEQFLRDYFIDFNSSIRYKLLYEFYFIKQLMLDEDVINQFISIYKLLNNEIFNGYDKSQKVILSNLLSVIFHHITREFKKHDSIPFSKTEKLFIDFIRELIIEPNYKYNVQFYADKLNVSIRTLQTIVKKNINMTPKQVIDDNLLIECKRQLICSDYLIQEIANNLGFEDPSVFSKFFKKLKGISPLEFRNKTR